MSRRKQQKPQHLPDDEEEALNNTMDQPESPSPTIDVTEGLNQTEPISQDAMMNDVITNDETSIGHNENQVQVQYDTAREAYTNDREGYGTEREYLENDFSDNDSLSDADSAPREEHRDASDEDCKDDYSKEDFENSAQTDDLSSVSNVTLGPLRHTNQAVAQFPENMSPPDVAMIHSTLYSLQQQQILQLHLIQQLHQHLVQGTMPNFPLMPLPLHASLPNVPTLTSTSDAPAQTVVTSIISTGSETMTTITTSSGGGQPAPPFRSHLAELETMTNKPVSMDDEKSKSVKADLMNRSSSSDEPYFKHRCKYCHKVFGSESALQIHIRSHTGERPFKCNICGNRFTTRGNLKVHFARHKQKYPHIQMNPNPVPEHLDKILPPPLASITSSVTNTDLPPNRSLAPALGVASLVAPKKERSPSPILTDHERSKSPDQNTAPIPLPSSLPPFGPGYDASSFLNKPNVKYEDPYEQFMEYDKSETTKLQQLVENLEHKMSDPNQCVICHRILSCKSALQMHYRTHTGERPFRCRICGRSFTTKGNLKTHMGVHRAKPPIRMLHRCPICQKEFTNSVVLQQHVRMHTPDMAGLDLATKISAYSPQYLMPPRPYAGSAPPTPLSGLDLSKSSDNMDSSREKDSISEESGMRSSPEGEPQAKRTKLDEDVMKYESYDTSDSVDADPRNQYSSLADLEERVQAMSRNLPTGTLPMDTHQELRPDDRSRSNSPISNANSENNNDNDMSGYDGLSRTTSPAANFGALDLSQDRGCICTFCNKSFACRSALEIHYRSHTKERPFECTVCHRGFTTKGNMRQHLLTHKIRDMAPEEKAAEETKETKPNDIENNNSPGKFLSPPASSTHATPISSTPHTGSNTATTPSPFVRRPSNKHNCDVCQKPFSSASALQIHMRTHTGQKPFKCEVCGKAFTTKGNLKVHMGTHMWNNGPSRRGRRIAMDSPIPMPTKESEFMFHRSPELYFPYPGFPGGLSPKFGNEIPVIQGMNGGYPHYSTPVSASDYMKLAAGFTPQMPHDTILKQYSAMTGDKDTASLRNNNEGEADRSVSDRSVSDENQSDQSPPAAGADSVWSWKTTCHLCNKVCVSVAALEMHLQSHIMKHEETTPKPMLNEGRVM